MGLPIGYILLEYIESSGTQYINTGYKITSNYEELNMKFRFLDKYSSKTLIGTQDLIIADNWSKRPQKINYKNISTISSINYF